MKIKWKESESTRVEGIKQAAKELLRQLADLMAAKEMDRIPLSLTEAMGVKQEALHLGLIALLDFAGLPHHALDAHLTDLAKDFKRRNAPVRRGSGCSGPYDNEPGDM